MTGQAVLHVPVIGFLADYPLPVKKHTCLSGIKTGTVREQLRLDHELTDSSGRSLMVSHYTGIRIVSFMYSLLPGFLEEVSGSYHD
jgi:hypothetical protein